MQGSWQPIHTAVADSCVEDWQCNIVAVAAVATETEAAAARTKAAPAVNRTAEAAVGWDLWRVQSWVLQCCQRRVEEPRTEAQRLEAEPPPGCCLSWLLVLLPSQLSSFVLPSDLPLQRGLSSHLPADMTTNFTCRLCVKVYVLKLLMWKLAMHCCGLFIYSWCVDARQVYISGFPRTHTQQTAQEVSSSQTRNGTAELQRPGSACETDHSTQLQQGNFLYTTAVHTGKFEALASKGVYGMPQAKPEMHVQHVGGRTETYLFSLLQESLPSIRNTFM